MRMYVFGTICVSMMIGIGCTLGAPFDFEAVKQLVSGLDLSKLQDLDFKSLDLKGLADAAGLKEADINYQELLLKVTGDSFLSQERLPHESFNDYFLRHIRSLANSTEGAELPSWASKALRKYAGLSDEDEGDVNKFWNHKTRKAKKTSTKDNLVNTVMTHGAEWAFNRIFPALQIGTVYASRKSGSDVINMTHVPVWDDAIDLQAVFEYVRDARLYYAITGRPAAPQGFKRRIPHLYVNDGAYARADAAAHILMNLGLEPPAKIYIFGELSLSTHFAANPLVSDVHWAYHVAPVVIHKSVPYVFDPSVNWTSPMTLQSWVSTLTPTGKKLEGVSVCTPWTYIWFSDQCDYNPVTPKELTPEITLTPANANQTTVNTLVSALSTNSGQESIGIDAIQEIFLDKETLVFERMCLKNSQKVNIPEVLGDFPPWLKGIVVVHDDSCRRRNKRPTPGSGPEGMIGNHRQQQNQRQRRPTSSRLSSTRPSSRRIPPSRYADGNDDNYNDQLENDEFAADDGTSPRANVKKRPTKPIADPYESEAYWDDFTKTKNPAGKYESYNDEAQNDNYGDEYPNEDGYNNYGDEGYNGNEEYDIPQSTKKTNKPSSQSPSTSSSYYSPSSKQPEPVRKHWWSLKKTVPEKGKESSSSSKTKAKDDYYFDDEENLEDYYQSDRDRVKSYDKYANFDDEYYKYDAENLQDPKSEKKKHWYSWGSGDKAKDKEAKKMEKEKKKDKKDKKKDKKDEYLDPEVVDWDNWKYDDKMWE